ncbi:hypothetical protein, partial [uncultured Muribaculum sp.]
MRNFLAEKFSISANAYYLCGVVKMLPPRQRYKKGARLANFKTIEYANDRRNKRMADAKCEAQGCRSPDD